MASASIKQCKIKETASACRECGIACKLGNKFCSRKCRMVGRALPNQSIPRPKYKAGECLHCKAGITMPLTGSASGRKVIPKYCNRHCYDKYRAAQRECNCDHCGGTFSLSPNRRKHNKKYCSMECRKLGLKTPPTNCRHCGVWFTAIKHVKSTGRYITDKAGIYCSVDCSKAGLSANQDRKDKISAAFSGANHPNWQGGTGSVRRGYRGSDWLKIAEQARKRDGYICQDCGMTQFDNGRKLEVHHKVPFRQDTSVRSNRLSNLVTLCKSCHTTADHKYRRENPVQMVLM